MRHLPWQLLSLALVLVTSCDPGSGKPSRSGPVAPGFHEVAAEVGLDFVHQGWRQHDYQLPEIMGPGCAWIDYDGDGWLDAYFVSGSDDEGWARNRLYRNLLGKTFEEISNAAGADDAGIGMGCAVGDYDRDGDADLYVTNFGANVLYRNDDGRFTNVTKQAGVGDAGWGASAAFVDVDEDGWLDLFVVNYMVHPPRSQKRCADSAGRQEYCGPNTHFPPARDTLYRNRGDGTFVDGTREAGMADTLGNGLGVTCADLDGDGHTDLYVANDASANQLWVGDGKGRFVDRAVEWGAAYNQNGQAEAGMGVHAEDIDGDGLRDIFVTHLVTETNTFYRGRSDARFEDWTHATGLGPPSVPRTSFGAGFFDADHDGDLDLLVTNGGVRRGRRDSGVTLSPPWDRYAERDQYFEHVAPAQSGGESGGPFGLAFEARGDAVGISRQPPHLGRGLALGDYDNDGDVDALVSSCVGAARLYRNDLTKLGHWLVVEPLSADTGAIAYGARVEVHAAGKTWRRSVQPAYSYLASNDPRLHFGLGEATVADVSVTWPDGTTTEVPGQEADQRLEVRQPVGGSGE